MPTLTLRVSYVGELGFELHHPARAPAGALRRGCSRRASRSGSSTSATARSTRCGSRRPTGSGARTCPPDWTPLEAGLERFVAFDKGDFVGREALLRQRDDGIARTLACLTVETDDADAHGYEPVRVDGTPIGYVAAGGYGHVVEQSIALAYLPVEHAEPGTRLTVDILGEPRPAVVAPQPIYDPQNLRLLS